MAKMFYTLEEAAAAMGVSEDQVKEMASDGKIKQYRDRDKLMFKRDEVDAFAGSAQSSGESGIELSDTGLDMGDQSSDTDAISLDEPEPSKPTQQEDPRQATGISVFDADEVELADPMAQTQVTDSFGDIDDDISLESVGSGSGLLDLTRESDDTSLGAELLEEIYPGGDTGVSAGIGGSGTFESPVAEEESAVAVDEPAYAQQSTAHMVEAGPNDPAGSFMSAGFLVGALAAIVIMFIVVFSMVMDVPIELTQQLTADGGTMLYAAAGGTAVGGLILGVIGFFIGKAVG